jgi:hypothetical protein
MSVGRVVIGFAVCAPRWAACALTEYLFLGLAWAWRLHSEVDFRFWPYCPAVLASWLLVRGSTLRRQEQAGRTQTAVGWLESHLTGLGLGMTMAWFFLEVPLSALPGLTSWSLATLLAVELAGNHLARQRAARWVLRRWTLGWPQTGELGVIIATFWAWQRLTGIGPLPLPIYAWIGGATGAVLTLTRGPGPSWRSLIAPLVVVAPVVWAYAGLPDAHPVSRLALLVVGTLGAPWIHRLLEQGPGRRSARLAWIWLLVLLAGWLSDPLLHAQAVGAGDAQWYTTVLADAIAQTQAGIFPPLIGQSVYAFNGAIFPGAFAPYYQLAGVTVHFLAFGALPVYAIQHLLAFASIAGGMLAVHWVLRRQTGASHAYCAGLAVLYGACPAWLGAIYSMDMYMTLLTMPWVPLVFHGSLRCFRQLDASAILWTSVPLALVCLAHPPTGMWTSLVLASVQAGRVCWRRHSWGSELRWLLGSGTLFAALVCLPVVFSLQTNPASDTFRHDYVISTLAAHWKNAWLPVSSGAALLSDQQLGWSVVLLGGSGLGLALWRRRDEAKVFAPAAAGVLLLLSPIPRIQPALWRGMPDLVKSITDNWPTQRLLPVLAGILIIAGGGALLRGSQGNLRRRTLLTVALLLAICWSLGEAQKFRARGHAVTASPEISAKRLLPENIVLSRYAYHMFAHQPGYVSDGVMNPLLKQSLLDPSTLQPLATNLTAASGNREARAILFKPDPSDPSARLVSPALQLQPGREYLLELDLETRSMPGTLVFRGDRLEREYIVNYEPAGANLGSAAGQRRHVSLWTTGSSIETVRLSFYPQQPGLRPPDPLGTLHLSEIPTADLPVQLEGQSPYRASVSTPVPAWLETSRMFIPGYTASYEGKATEVRASPQGLVLVRVPAGTGRVDLTYRLPPPMRAALLVSATAWSGLAILALGRLLSRRWRGAVAEVTETSSWAPRGLPQAGV